MQAVEEEQRLSTFVPEVLGREDYRIIGEFVAANSHVLDLGCGKGDLLSWLVEHKRAEARGVEISASAVRACVARGLSVYQGDIDQGLVDFPDDCFDYVILSQTLQETQNPLEVMQEMARVGKRVIVAFPNFGHWRVRLSLLTGGRAPKAKHLPYEWYDTPNIHVLTLLDFEETLPKAGLQVERAYFLAGEKPIGSFRNMRAQTAIYLLGRV